MRLIKVGDGYGIKEDTHAETGGKDRGYPKNCPRQGVFLLWQPNLSIGVTERQDPAIRKIVRTLHSMSTSQRY
jgi:hypothetical protein